MVCTSRAEEKSFDILSSLMMLRVCGSGCAHIVSRNYLLLMVAIEWRQFRLDLLAIEHFGL